MSSVSIMIVVEPSEFAAMEQKLAEYEASVKDLSRDVLPDATVGVVLSTSVGAGTNPA